MPSEETETGNVYSEYIYVNNQWEKLGETPIEVDLTDYVKNTDYATSSKGGVIKYNANYGINVVNGFLVSVTKTYANYQTSDNYTIIGKGTLENVLNARIGDISSVLDAINGEVI